MELRELVLCCHAMQDVMQQSLLGLLQQQMARIAADREREEGLLARETALLEAEAAVKLRQADLEDFFAQVTWLPSALAGLLRRAVRALHCLQGLPGQPLARHSSAYGLPGTIALLKSPIQVANKASSAEWVHNCGRPSHASSI